MTKSESWKLFMNFKPSALINRSYSTALFLDAFSLTKAVFRVWCILYEYLVVKYCKSRQEKEFSKCSSLLIYWDLIKVGYNFISI